MKEYQLRGKTFPELQKMSLNEFAQLVPARERRKIKRGFTEQENKFLKLINDGKNNLRTHCREMIILPQMVGKTIKIYNGKEFIQLIIDKELLGHRLGEFSSTRKKVSHSAPGIGATRSSASLSVR